MVGNVTGDAMIDLHGIGDVRSCDERGQCVAFACDDTPSGQCGCGRDERLDDDDGVCVPCDDGASSAPGLLAPQ